MKIHFVIGKKDGDIGYWIESLENGYFSHYVSIILKAELRNKIASLPVPQQRGRISKTKDTSIYVSDKKILDMLSKIPKRKRSKYIRSIIRKHLDANYKKGSKSEQNIKKMEEPAKEENTVPITVEKVEEEKDVINPDESKTKSVELEHTEEPISDFKAKMMRMANR